MWSQDIGIGITAFIIIAPGTVTKLFMHGLIYCSTVRELRHRGGKFVHPREPWDRQPSTGLSNFRACSFTCFTAAFVTLNPAFTGSIIQPITKSDITESNIKS